MKRHSKDMIRHHRQRIIKKNKTLLNQIMFGGTENLKDGELSKHSWHHHKCLMCNPRYKRDTGWKREIAQQY